MTEVRISFSPTSWIRSYVVKRRPQPRHSRRRRVACPSCASRESTTRSSRCAQYGHLIAVHAERSTQGPVNAPAPAPAPETAGLGLGLVHGLGASGSLPVLVHRKLPAEILHLGAHLLEDVRVAGRVERAAD